LANLTVGEFFEPEVHLGGRLFSTEEFDGVAGSTVGQKITNLKIAAGASFAGGGFSAKVSGKYEEANNKKEDSKSATMTQSISWCADGGDTTLCNKYVRSTFYDTCYLRELTSVF
jgi:hypothetical protein